MATVGGVIIRRRTRRRVLALLATLAAVTLATSGCTADPAEDWSTTHKPVWSVHATLLSNPRIAGDVVLWQ